MAHTIQMIILFAAILVAYFGHAAAISTHAAVEERALARSRAEMKQMEAEVATAVAKMREGLTVERAVKSLKKTFNATPAFVSMLNEIAHPQTHRKSGQRGHGAQFLGVENHKADPYAGIEKAKVMLNDMLTEVTQNIDKEHKDCKSIFTEKCQLMEFNRQDVDEMNAEAASANGKIMDSDAAIHFIEETELPRLSDILEENIKVCDEKIGGLKEHGDIVANDIEVISGVVNMTGCADSAFLQRNATVKTQHCKLQKQLAQIKSSSVKKNVQKVLQSLLASGQRKQKTDPAGSAVTDPAVPEEEVPGNPCDEGYYDELPIDDTIQPPNCNKLLTQFLQIQVDMKELHDQLMEQLAQTEEECARTQRSLNAEIAQQNTLLLQHQTELAFATQNLRRVGLATSMKEDEHAQFKTEVEHLRGECTENINTYESEKAALEKIRSEIYLKIQGSADKAMFTDCELGDWESSGCSKECGGGTETLTRKPTQLSAHGGVDCDAFPMEAKLDCNTHACPIDCIEDPWKPWSTCSAECDGGIKLRTREIVQHPTRGGTPCGEVTESESCNTQTCDPDCVLGDWSGWTECSKPCDGGHQMRRKYIVEPAAGRGKCPAEDSEERYAKQTCNEQSCEIVSASGMVYKANEPVLCERKADIVFLIDGSGSLGVEAFEKSKMFAKEFALAFDKQNAQISVALFSGPLTWYDYYDCQYNVYMSQMSDEQMESKCGMKLATTLSNDTDATLAAIDALPYPAKTTFTSGALLLAKNVLRFARPDAERIAVLLTDGRPIDHWSTWYAALYLKGHWDPWHPQTRLVTVPIEGLGLAGADTLFLKHLASDDQNDNTLDVPDFRQLGEISTVNTLVEDVCGMQTVFPMQKCQDWCNRNVEEWAVKCEESFQEGACSGCSECATSR